MDRIAYTKSGIADKLRGVFGYAAGVFRYEKRLDRSKTTQYDSIGLFLGRSPTGFDPAPPPDPQEITRSQADNYCAIFIFTNGARSQMKPEFTPSREITLKEAAEEYLSEKAALGALSETSVYNRRYELNRFTEFCHERKVDYAKDITKNTVITYLLGINVNKASKVSIMFILTGFMDFLVDEALMLDNIASTIEKPKTYMPKTDYLTYDELERLFAAEANSAPKKSVDRNLLLFGLFTDICLRVSEVINLKLEDVRLDQKEVWVTRKQQKTDNIPLNADLVEKFLNWYAIRPRYKGNDLPWVFLSTHGQQLKRRQVHYIVSMALRRAGIAKRKQGPHLLRHSGASLKARAGENLIMIQYLLGHENLNTTRRYLHFNWSDLQEMVDRSPLIGK